MKSRPYHHGDLRRALINAAIVLVEETGPDGFTLREVARRARVSHTAPYRHFHDKNDLLAAVAEQGFTDLRAAMAKAIGPARTPLQRLQRCGAAYVAFALERTAHFRVMFGSSLDACRQPLARTAAELAFADLMTVVAACQQADVLPRADTCGKARLAWSLVHGIAHLAIGRQLPLKAPEEIASFVASATNSLIDGLRKGKAQR